MPSVRALITRFTPTNRSSGRNSFTERENTQMESGTSSSLAPASSASATTNTTTSGSSSNNNNNTLPPLAPPGTQQRRASRIIRGPSTNNSGVTTTAAATNHALEEVVMISNDESVAQRQEAAIDTIQRRRSSVTNNPLLESRAQDERPESARHQKRRSTIGTSDVAEALRLAAEDSTIFMDDGAGEESKIDDSLQLAMQSAQRAANVAASVGAGPDAVPSSQSQASSSNSTATSIATVRSVSSTPIPDRPVTPATITVAAGATNTANQEEETIVYLPSVTPAHSTINPSLKGKPTREDSSTSTSSSKQLDPMRPDIQIHPPPTVDDLPKLTAALKSGDPERELRAAISFRMLLSKSYAAPIQEVVACNVIPTFVQFLARDGEERLQLESSWALTNIASGTTEHTMLVLECGALPLLLKLLRLPNREIREQAVWGIGNIAGDSPRTRDIVLAANAVKYLVPLLHVEIDRKDPASLSLLRNMVWATANFCRGKPPPNFALVRPLLPTLKRVIMLNDHEALADACWALNYLSNSNEQIQEVIDSGVCPRLIELLLHPEQIVKTPALRAVGNIVTGDNDQTQYMIDLQVLPALRSLLTCSRRTIRGEACWTISNITAGNHNQIQQVIDANVIPHLVSCAMDSESYVAKEAIWAISNATSGGTIEQVVAIASHGAIPALVSSLSAFESLDNRIIMVALEGIENFLIAGDAQDTPRNEFIQIVKDCGGSELMNELSNHSHADVQQKAQTILTNFLNVVQPPVVKAPPEMWTPEEVKEAKRLADEAREKIRAAAGEPPSLDVNRAGKPPRRGSAYIPPQFYCPISQEIMVDPVSTTDGHVYDRENIAKWFATGNMTSPVTGAKLKSTQLTPNHPLRQMIEAFNPGYTRRADLEKEWSCVACTSMNNPVDVMCSVCGAERPPRQVHDPDATPLVLLASGAATV